MVWGHVWASLVKRVDVVVVHVSVVVIVVFFPE